MTRRRAGSRGVFLTTLGGGRGVSVGEGERAGEWRVPTRCARCQRGVNKRRTGVGDEEAEGTS